MAIDRAEFVAQVREFLRDKAEFNSLLDGQESVDTILELCADLAADDWNATAPFITTVTLESHPSRYILFYGTIIQVLRSAGLLYSRNRLNYSDGGLTVATSDRAREYMAWINSFLSEYEVKKRNMKISRNAESAYGGVESEYMYIGAWGQYLAFANLDNFTALRYGFYVF